MTATRAIRNFCIIAHIDHGKSTLADQFLLKTGTITAREYRAQTLDAMDLERERGITIRMHPVTLYYQLPGQTYELNLIDTPGHVDFSYEVSRSLAACEGAILLVDAFQGVQAQTVANAFLAMEHNLKIIPVLNKIDLEMARPDAVIAEMETALGIDPAEVLRCSGKAGLGIEELLQAIVDRIPPPPGSADAPLKALVYNSHFDTYKGVVVYVRIKDGSLKLGQRVKLMRDGHECEVNDIGRFRPAMTACAELSAGQVGYFTAQIKDIADVQATTAGPIFLAWGTDLWAPNEKLVENAGFLNKQLTSSRFRFATPDEFFRAASSTLPVTATSRTRSLPTRPRQRRCNKGCRI